MKGKRVLQKDCAKIRECHRNGEKPADIALKFKLHIATVYQILRETQKKPKKRGPPTLLVG